MNRKIFIAVVAFFSFTPFLTNAQVNTKQVLDKYKAYGVVPEKENNLKLKVTEISFAGDGKYEIIVDFGASKIEGNRMPLSEKDADIISSKLYILDAVSAEDKISAQTKKLVFMSSDFSFESFPMQGFGGQVTFETDKKIVLLCFEGTEPELNNFDTPSLFFVIELNGRKSKLLDKKPYYLKKILEKSE